VAGIADALTRVVDAFRGVSVDGDPLRATADPENIQTPSVWIPTPDIEFRFEKNRASITWTAYLIAPNAPKQRNVTEHLAKMIDAVTGLFPFTSGEAYTLTLSGGVSAQAYKLSWIDHTAIGA
jgi:hypothetical protein